jgi:hypothetical protein
MLFALESSAGVRTCVATSGGSFGGYVSLLRVSRPVIPTSRGNPVPWTGISCPRIVVVFGSSVPDQTADVGTKTGNPVYLCNFSRAQSLRSGVIMKTPQRRRRSEIKKGAAPAALTAGKGRRNGRIKADKQTDIWLWRAKRRVHLLERFADRMRECHGRRRSCEFSSRNCMRRRSWLT